MTQIRVKIVLFIIYKYLCYLKFAISCQLNISTHVCEYELKINCNWNAIVRNIIIETEISDVREKRIDIEEGKKIIFYMCINYK